MPLYEYHCKTCKKIIEKLQSIKAKNTIECSECGNKCKRIISKSSFKLIGEGFYCNDYSSGESKIDN